jgi:dTDP-4-dehydrorhamnose reductase
VNALVLGADGQLGTDLVRLLGSSAGVGRREVSVSDALAVDAILGTRRPAVVFNCAAYNAVDDAESDPAAARAVNTDGAFNVAAACARSGARLVHFSTNFVFDGRSARPYVETDEAAPQGAYARSKFDGERRVLEAQPKALVIRTAALFGGVRGSSFPERIRERAARAERIRVVSDQTVNPTYTADLAQAALGLAEEGLEGIVHLVSGECCSWDEFARAVLDELQLPTAVESIPSSAIQAAAPRPRNGCLESIRVSALRPWREGLREWARRRALETQ